MGKPRYIYFNDEIDERMKDVPNKSALINRLLNEHFDKAGFLNMSADELKTELAVRKLQKKTDDVIKEMRK